MLACKNKSRYFGKLWKNAVNAFITFYLKKLLNPLSVNFVL